MGNLSKAAELSTLIRASPIADVPPSFIADPRAREQHGASASRHAHDQLLSLLPASYRKELGDLDTTGRLITAYVGKDVRSPPVRARSEIVTERMVLPLIWTTGRVFLKPCLRILPEPRMDPILLMRNGVRQKVGGRGQPPARSEMLAIPPQVVSEPAKQGSVVRKRQLHGYIRRWNLCTNLVHDSFALCL
ncbi:hypothetical protein TrVFT333_006430 [Trichoderma virens FT-333]|nr:hypothetical protein TrVFT333_006430 [Trichoderma virens FT-333]